MTKQNKSSDIHRILVVDDDLVQCVLIKCSLDPDTYSVTIANDKQQALTLCERQYFDLAILDYELPDGSGAEIANSLNKSYNIPFVFITMIDDSKRARRPIELGALSYLIKPVAPKQLIILVENAFAEIEHRNDLQMAVDVHGTIGLALGIIMNNARISKNDGLMHLREYCQPRNLSMRYVADRIVVAYDDHIKEKHRKPFDLAKILQSLD
jgi:CheY-like chemotaxis protein